VRPFTHYDVLVHEDGKRLDRWKRENVVGKSCRLDFDPAGRDSFWLQMPAEASEELKELGRDLSEQVLPLLFPRFPEDFAARQGVTWERSGAKPVRGWPALTRWTVVDAALPLKWKPLVALRASAASKQAPRGVTRNRWQRWSVYYDPAARRVRYATNEKLYSAKVDPASDDLLDHSDGVWVIAELPRLGRVQNR
jgi:hypothetical protein